MLQALLASVASIKAQQTRMHVIGNNLANVNTTAFKTSRVNFQEMITQTVRGANRPSTDRGGTNPVQIGLGVLVGGTDVNTEQGSLSATNRPTDLAIQGSGMFIVGNGAAMQFTRDGSFDLDANGDLVHRSTGLFVLGWTADQNGDINVNSQVNANSKINIPFGSVTALQQTSKADFTGNLSSNSLPTDDPATSTVTCYDSLGSAHTITLKILNRQAPPLGTPPTGATASWDWEAYEGATLIGGSATGERLYFDSSGKMANPDAVHTMSITGINGADDFDVEVNLSNILQQSGATSIQSSGQNGLPPGSLSGFAVSNTGTISGTFTNGLTRTLGRIATAVFSNPAGLQRAESNLWEATGNSGQPEIGEPGSRGRGSMTPGFLEQSNVDIGGEFTDLIVTQRGFQANTRVVTTVDEMLQELINMKR